MEVFRQFSSEQRQNQPLGRVGQVREGFVRRARVGVHKEKRKDSRGDPPRAMPNR